MVSKAADFLTMSTKKESDITLRKLKERVDELEKDKVEKKLEFANEKRILEQKLYELEASKNQAIRNEKLLEERLKYQTEERDKSEKTINDKWKVKFNEKEE